MDMTKVFERIEELKPQMVKTLGELISYESFRQQPEEGAPFGRPARMCLDRALEICGGLGFITENIDGYAGTVKLYGGEPSLGILAHLDVVAAGEGWTRDPFDAVIIDGKLYGRGAMDDKGPAVSVIYAMKALKDLGVKLENGVELILGTDEECGSSDIAYFKEHTKMPKWLFTPDACYPLINIEKGHINARFTAECRSKNLKALHGGKTINAVPASASALLTGIKKEDISYALFGAGIATVVYHIRDNGDGTIELSAEGTSAHASTPETGSNALTALIKVLSLLPLDEPAKGLLTGLAEAFPHGETDGTSAGVKAYDETSGALTLVLSILDSEGDALSGAIDIRFPVCESVASICEKLGGTLSRRGFEPEINGSEPHCVPSDSKFVKALLGAYESVTGKKGECLAIGGGTYVHGTPGGVAFGCEIEGEDNRIHGADEFIRTDALVENAKIFAEAIVRVCNDPELK